MMKAIYPFFEWCQETSVYNYITSHEAAFPAIETFHIFGLTLLLGSIVILSLRLMGLMLKKQPVAELASELSPYLTSGIWLMLITGVFLFVATAVRNYGNTSFWVKMILLALALIFHYAYFRKLIRKDDVSIEAGHGKLAAALALILWFGVGMAGRSIGFFG